MKFEITGDLAQVARLALEPGAACWASKGSLMSMSREVKWELKVPGGLGGAVKRSFSGEGIALTYIRTASEGQEVILSANQPGKIVEWDLADGPVLTTRGSFVAAFGPAIEISVSVARRAGAAVFGGAGLFLQKISGQGIVLIHGSGDFIDRRMQPGESCRVSTGNLAAFSETVDYDIEAVGSVGRFLFGGEGLFMTRLTGPGRVLMQTLKRRAGSSAQSVE